MASCRRATRCRSPVCATPARRPPTTAWPRKRRRAARCRPMFEAFSVTLREGVEAALVVGIIVAFLRREGYERHLGAVWAGIGAATAASLLGALVLYRWAVNEEVFEGLLYLGSAVIV